VRRRLYTDGRILLRVVVVWIVTAGSALLLADYLPGFHVDNPQDALGAAAAVAAINAVVWPFFMRLALGAVVLTLGLGVFVINGMLVAIVMRAVPGVTLTDPAVGAIVGTVLTAVTAFTSGLLALDDDHFYRRFIIAPAFRRKRVPVTDPPGVLFLQIDGLGYEVLRRAIRGGDAPVLARWLADGTHALRSWHTDWPSQTGASQAGILHGSNVDMPAFRWYEKESGRLLVCNRASSAAEIEARHSDGAGLLHADGAGHGNLFTGDAPHVSLTMSVAGRKKGRLGAGYYGYFANPYNAARTLFAFVAEVTREYAQAFDQRRRDVRPRVRRGGLYPFLRASASVIARDVTVQAVLEDMVAGRAVVYADFTGYDEVAHHSGIERYESLAVLRGIDRQIGRLADAVVAATRPYRIVVLSDHGQSQGPAFADQHGETLEDLVREACGLPRVTPLRRHPGSEARGRLAGVTEREGPISRALRHAAHVQIVDGEPIAGEDATRRAAAQLVGGEPVLTLASGNLGLIYLTDRPGRVSIEELQRRYPELLPTLLEHPGVGFLLAKSAGRGPVAMSRLGARYLDSGEVEGEDPLAPFGPLAADRVRRTYGFSNTADVMVNSAYDDQTEQVESFEPFVGSHGGLGGPQTEPFVLYPADLELPVDSVLGAEALHQVFRGWLSKLGHTAFS